MAEELDLSICCVKGCDRPSLALGLCVNHWRRNRKYGSPVALKARSGLFRGLSSERRFALQVRKGSGCWNWTGLRDGDGYGLIRGVFDGVRYARAHRFSYAMHKGEHPGELLVLHRCDNPSCVNPAHLFLGTNAENMADEIAKGRARVARGEASGHARLTEEQARAIMGDARPYTAIARDYGVSAQTISSLKNRASWAHLEGEIAKAQRVSPRKGISDKLTPDDVRYIRASTERGVDLALRFGVSTSSITDIRKRRSWAHIE